MSCRRVAGHGELKSVVARRGKGEERGREWEREWEREW